MAADAAIELDASIGVALPDVQARVTGLLALSISPPPSLAALIASAQALLAALQALLAAPLPDVSATAAALADLQATLGQLNASLAFSVNFGTLLGTAGIHYYVFAGRADALGGELGSLLSGGLPGGAGGAEHIAGAVLLANDGGAITALQTVLRS
jgi:hypothetical protein